MRLSQLCECPLPCTEGTINWWLPGLPCWNVTRFEDQNEGGRMRAWEAEVTLTDKWRVFGLAPVTAPSRTHAVCWYGTGCCIIQFLNTLTHTCTYMVFSLVCIRGKLLVLWSLCKSWMTLSLGIFWNTLTPERECFCNHQGSLTILSLHDLINQTKNSKFFMTGRRLKMCYQGNKEK